MKRKIPSFKTDAEAERFVATADLTKYDLSGGTPVHFEFAPQLWVFAGPNGAGKSTMMRRYKVAAHMPVVNADDIAQELRRLHPTESEATILGQAGRQAIALRNHLLTEARSFAIETTLTGHSELHLMQAAREQGYKVNLIYVTISRVELSNSRVTTRATTGGHDVPEGDVMRRFHRSLEHLPAAIAASDRAYIFDNSGKGYKLLQVGPPNGAWDDFFAAPGIDLPEREQPATQARDDLDDFPSAKTTRTAQGEEE